MSKIIRFAVGLQLAFIWMLGGSTVTQAQNLSDLTFGTDSTFDAVTWNIEWFPKRASTDDSVAQIIESMQADVIAVQEIDDTTLFRQMINSLPHYELLIDGSRFNGLGYVYNSNTVQIQDFYSIFDTPPYYNAFPRSPIVLELSYEGETFVLINNHFKCCGNGVLEPGDTSDEEFRRYEASSYLKHYIDINWANDRVILLGDLNDVLTDAPENNVFEMFLEDSTHYRFADWDIANGPIAYWSYPNWPSHLDHILITDENFADLNKPGSTTETIRVDDYMVGGFSTYDYYVSDHRPVGIKIQTGIPTAVDFLPENKYNLYPNPTHGWVQLEFSEINTPTSIKITDMQGRVIHTQTLSTPYFQYNIEGPKGCYLIHVQGKEGFEVTKVVKL